MQFQVRPVHHLRIDYPISCIPTCCSEANPPKYLPITYGEYRVWGLNNSYRPKLVEA